MSVHARAQFLSLLSLSMWLCAIYRLCIDQEPVAQAVTARATWVSMVSWCWETAVPVNCQPNA